jgi:glycosyltransferase involved in cell wall biosynthesis/GT2 family glycosyltransferase
MRVALVHSEASDDADALRIARLLRARGHDVSLVIPSAEPVGGIPDFAAAWRAEGFACIPLGSARLAPVEDHFPRDRWLATARTLSGLVTRFDAAWFFERHWAMPALRDRRFRERLLPVVVLARRADPLLIPNAPDEINLNSARQYVARWADMTCGGAHAAGQASVSEVEQLWIERSAAPVATLRAPATSPAVTICVPHREAPAFLPEMLRSLENQTNRDFTVVVVDDGSESEEARLVFESCERRYASRGWKFVGQSRQYPGAARNRAARESESEFLLFVDADDIARPTMVDRFLCAALRTGDDCLVAPHYGFRDDPQRPSALLYEPPASLVGSMLDDMHGGSCIFTRREAFWSIGGFTELAGVGYEDYEFHVRCNLEGLRWDVLPDFVFRYRMPQETNMSRSTSLFENRARVRRLYEERLSEMGLGPLPSALASAFDTQERLGERADALRRAIHSRSPKVGRRSRGLRLLLLTCYSPYTHDSGWAQRVRWMIRYFADRHDVALLTSMAPADFPDARSEAARQGISLRAVQYSQCCGSNGATLPFRVRERYMDTVQDALRSMPTEHYDAAILDSIFMAEFRHDIDTVRVLTEHNIESSLLRQASTAGSDLPIPDDFRNAAQEAERLEAYENRAWPEFLLRTVVSEADGREMDRRTRLGRTVVAANGADLSRWLAHARPDTSTVLFAGHLGYLPNVDAVNWLTSDIWPRVRRAAPEARLIVAGRHPTPELRSAVGRAAGVELVADPVSMDRVAARASLTVAPLRLGSGTRLKILESMAWGLPVVSTTIGCEGLEVVELEHLLIGDSADQLADAIVRGLRDAPLWRRLRQAGRQLIADRYQWNQVFLPMEAALLELVS